jgi:CPA2 family monovalent cation:H+ antiporter-2
MPHDVSLIAAVAAAFGLALALGLAAQRLGIPPLVGYLVAGILIGPATPGYVADVHLTQQLAELGVMLMMFGVGLHFSLDDLLAVRRIAVPGALVQMMVATALGAGTAILWGWSPGSGLVLGLSLSVASTVVLLRGLEARGVLASVDGRIAVGWLVVEDLAVVLILVLLPALLWFVARTGSRELFTLAVISAAIGVAVAAASLFSVSYALGAFFAGMLLRESALSHRAAEESLPLRDAFSVLFFVSVGMLFEPSIVVREPVHLAAVLGIVLVGKTVAAVLLVRGFRYSLGTALTVGAGLAQIGEFSFIVAALGRQLGLLPADGVSLVVAAALISISLNPLFFAAAEAGRRRFPPTGGADPLAELPGTVTAEELSGHVVLVGHGRVGRRIAESLVAHGIPVVVAEQNREEVERLRRRKMLAVAGDATEPAVLIQAHVARASVLVVATPDASQIRRMVETARALNPRLEVLLRTHTDGETEILRRDGMGIVFMGEAELARAMTDRVVRDWAARQTEAESLT